MSLQIQKGFVNEPQRCKSCLKAGKDKKKIMYTITCAVCGCVEQVPFEPKENRPVYCKACFASRK